MHKECTQRDYKGITELSSKAKETTNSPTDFRNIAKLTSILAY